MIIHSFDANDKEEKEWRRKWERRKKREKKKRKREMKSRMTGREGEENVKKKTKEERKKERERETKKERWKKERWKKENRCKYGENGQNVKTWMNGRIRTWKTWNMKHERTKERIEMNKSIS